MCSYHDAPAFGKLAVELKNGYHASYEQQRASYRMLGNVKFLFSSFSYCDAKLFLKHVVNRVDPFGISFIDRRECVNDSHLVSKVQQAHMSHRAATIFIEATCFIHVRCLTAIINYITGENKSSPKGRIIFNVPLEVNLDFVKFFKTRPSYTVMSSCAMVNSIEELIQFKKSNKGNGKRNMQFLGRNGMFKSVRALAKPDGHISILELHEQVEKGNQDIVYRQPYNLVRAVIKEGLPNLHRHIFDQLLLQHQKLSRQSRSKADVFYPTNSLPYVRNHGPHITVDEIAVGTINGFIITYEALSDSLAELESLGLIVMKGRGAVFRTRCPRINAATCEQEITYCKKLNEPGYGLDEFKYDGSDNTSKWFVLTKDSPLCISTRGKKRTRPTTAKAC